MVRVLTALGCYVGVKAGRGLLAAVDGHDLLGGGVVHHDERACVCWQRGEAPTSVSTTEIDTDTDTKREG